MESEDLARQVQALAEEMSASTSRWEARAKKLERDLERARQKLQQIRIEHKRRLDALWATYAGATAPSLPPSPQEASQRRRMTRGSMDAPVLQLIREHFHDGDFTVHDVIASWNAQHPADTLNTSTVRGVLNRHVKDGRLEVEKGGRGNGNLDRFTLKTGAEVSATPGGASIELAH